MKSNARLKKLVQYLAHKRLDAFMVTHPANVFYLSGFSGEGILLVFAGQRYLITDFRYREEAREEARGWRTVLRGRIGTMTAAANLITRLKPEKIAFEEAALSFQDYRRFRSAVKGSCLIPAKDVIEKMRKIKDPEEIALIARACRLAVRAMEYARRIVRPGVSEQEVAARIEDFIRSGEKAEVAFSPIVAAGGNASRPHALPGTRKIGKNDLVLVDLGARFRRYNSDLTRTLMAGKIRGKKKSLLPTVREAQRRALAAVRPGVEIAEVDRIAREYIKSRGRGREFGHALGHGVGLEVHEEPSVSGKNRERLAPGMVITIEPGVYVKGMGGARWEDTVLVTGDGCRVLTMGTTDDND